MILCYQKSKTNLHLECYKKVFPIYAGQKIATNVLGLCEGGELEVQMFILAQMSIRIPNVQI
jgi:hypothetical protein